MLDFVSLEQSIVELQQSPGGLETLRSITNSISDYLNGQLKSFNIKPLPRYIIPVLRKRRLEAERCRRASKLKNDPSFLKFLDEICADPQDSIVFKIRSALLLLERHMLHEFGVIGEITLCGHCFQRKTRFRHIILSKNKGIPICRSCFKVKVIELVSNGIPPVLLPFEREKSSFKLRFQDAEKFNDLEAFYMMSRDP